MYSFEQRLSAMIVEYNKARGTEISMDKVNRMIGEVKAAMRSDDKLMTKDRVTDFYKPRGKP